MDMPIEEYLKKLQLAIEAMLALAEGTPTSVKKVVKDNYWQAQSAFNYKVERTVFSKSELGTEG